MKTIKIISLFALSFSLLTCKADTKPTKNNIVESNKATKPINKRTIKVALLLDTSNSMDGLIDQARELDIQTAKYDPANKDFDKCTSCRICFSDYKKDEEVGILPCKHFFHYSCIQEWGKRRPVCPFCDIDIPTVNEQAAKKQKTS